MSPVADDLLLCGRWPQLRSLTLTNLWCSPQTGLNVTATFLAAHANLQVLHLDLSAGAGAGAQGASLVLPPDALPRLRELRANREDWRAWYAIAQAYDLAGDRNRGRKAMRHAIELERRSR